MNLENWVINVWLEKRASDAEEIGRLLALADARLEDYQRARKAELSTDVQLGLTYDAIRTAATAALRAAGYRVVRGNNEHYRTLEALEFSIDPHKKLVPTLDKLRKKRNIGWYDVSDKSPKAKPITAEPWQSKFAKTSKRGFARTTLTSSSDFPLFSPLNTRLYTSASQQNHFVVFSGLRKIESSIG